MPITYTYSDDGQQLTLVGEGYISESEMTSVHLEVFKDTENFSKINSWLSDFSATKHIEISANGLRNLAMLSLQQIRAFQHPGRVAVVSSTDLVYGLSRMWHAFYQNEVWESRVFRREKDARAWLEQVHESVA